MKLTNAPILRSNIMINKANLLAGFLFLGVSTSSLAEELRVIVSYDNDVVVSSASAKSTTSAVSLGKTSDRVCLNTIDGAREICVPRPSGAAQKNIRVLSNSVSSASEPKPVQFQAFNVDADSFEQVKETLESTGWYATVEKDIIVHTNGYTNDPWLTSQYYLDDPETSTRDSKGAHNFFSVLSVEQIEQQEPIGVGIIDSGFYDIGEEMVFHGGATFANSGPVERGNDYLLDVGESCTSHGLGVAGVVGATANNGIAYTGAGGNVKVYAAVALDCGTGGLYAAAESIRWFAGESFIEDGISDFQGDVKVLNLSLGAGAYEGEGLRCPSYMQSAIDFARSKGIAIVVSAGNDGNDVGMHTPSNCDGVIVAGANGREGYRSSFSNHGEEVDISAGGEMVAALSPDITREVGYDGTSYSAPFVTSALAHAYRLKPDMTPSQAELILKLSAREFTDPTCEYLGCGTGILDVKRMLEVAATLDSEDSNRISWALNDESECDQQWYVDSFGKKSKMCSMLKVTFLNNPSVEGVKYRMYSSDWKNPDAPEELVIETTENTVLFSKDDIDVGLYDYSVVLCTDEACSSESIRFELETKDAFITDQPAVCQD
ncbi:MAG: hypothetical protein CL840_04705 [Crocinitomicaceae bacterium]|nr:hypothetical protein [Crocinitomicaceae bacterium]